MVGNGDYNGDGKADILWRNTSTGQNWMYLMNGSSIANSVPVDTVSNQLWKIAGDGDYNGDGRSDVLWRNDASGENRLYLMDANSIISILDVNVEVDLDRRVMFPD